MPLPVSRSGNPVLNEKAISGQARPAALGERMTLQGAINKSFLLLVVLLAMHSARGPNYMATGDAARWVHLF